MHCEYVRRGESEDLILNSGPVGKILEQLTLCKSSLQFKEEGEIGWKMEGKRGYEVMKML